MKKIVIVFMLLLIVMTLVSAREAHTQVEVTLLNTQPDPVRAGQMVEVRFQLQNHGQVAAQNVELVIHERHPFSMAYQESNVIDIGTLEPYQVGSFSRVIRRTLAVAPDAIDGANDVLLEVRYTVAGKQYSVQYTEPIHVNAIDATISVQKVEAQPIAPGKQGTIDIHLKNIAYATLRDVTVQLDMSAVPFAPIGTTTQQKVPVLEKDESLVFSYTVMALPTATGGVYSIPITITFFDTLNNKFTIQDMIGVIIGGEPDITIMVDTHQLRQGFTQGTVPVRIVNKGSIDVKFVDMHIGSTNALEVLSANRVYLGNIDSDDFDFIDIRVRNKDSEAQTVVLPITLYYKDANKQDYEQHVDLSIPLPESSNERSGGLLVWLIIIAAVLGIGYWFMKRK